MNPNSILLIVVACVLVMYLTLQILEHHPKETLCVLEVDIHRAKQGKNTTRLIFQDIVLPSGDHVQDLDISIPTTTFTEMRKRKQYRINVEFLRGRKFIYGKFHSFITA